MKTILFSLSAILLNFSILFAESPLYHRVKNASVESIQSIDGLFVRSTAFTKGYTAVEGINESIVLELNHQVKEKLLREKYDRLDLSIPAPDGVSVWTLQLVRSTILTSDFRIKTSDGKTFDAPDAVFYQGIVNNDEHSMATISIFQNEVTGIVSNHSGNYDLGLLEGHQQTFYIFYHSNELAARIPFDCKTADADNVPPASDGLLAGDCRVVRVYIECDFDLYSKRNSSIANVNSFVSGMFNQVAALYTNESIATQISEIFVWTSTDPYISQTTSGNVLSTFRTTRTSFNGNIAHLLSTRSANLGGVAYLDILCSSSYKHAFSNIYNTYSTVPTYSWTVNVFTHEMGHNLGSNHTQWCGWTGGALDNCYTTEGGCAAGPAPVNGGTIMSYCHLSGVVGVNFSNGFGTQPGNKIRSRYNAATCITGGPAITVSPASASVCTGGSVALTASGGTSYVWTPTTGLSSSTSASVTASPASSTTYTVSSTNAGCTSTLSVPVTVLAAVNRGTLANGNQTFSGSGDPSSISFSATPSGGAGSFAYQWYSRSGIQTAPTGTSTTGWTAVSGATGATYDPGVQSSSVSFAVMVDATGTPDCGGFAWSNGVRQITVDATSGFSSGILTNGNQTFCSSGGDPALISFSTAPSGSTSFTRQWYYKSGIQAAPSGNSVSGWTVIASATGSSYDPPAGLTASRTYACFVTPASGIGAWAGGVRQITVLPVFNPGTVLSADETFCTSGNPSNITLATNPVGSGAYTWRWYFKESSSSACPTGSDVTGWSTNSTSTNITGTTTTGAGVVFDPISAGSLNNGRTFAVLITPIANGAIPSCGTAQWATNCRKTNVITCVGNLEMESSNLDAMPLPKLGLSYPNPTNGIAAFDYVLADEFSGSTIEFFSMDGKLISKIKCTAGNNSAEIDVRNWPVGIYYYTLSYFGTKLDSKKIVVIE
jgi:hypothetical protein